MRVLKDLLLLFMFVICRVVAEGKNVSEVESSGKWQVLYRLVKDCASKSEPAACLKLKFLTFLDRAYAIQEPLMLTDYLVLVKDPDSQDDEVRTGRSLSQNELNNILTQPPEKKNEILDDMLSQKVDAFFNSRTIQFNIPMDDFTGRSKKVKPKKKKKLLKKAGMIFAGCMMVAGMMGKMFMGKIGLIAGKALLVSKIALILSVVMLLKKLGGGKGGGKGGGGKGGGGGGGGEEEIMAQVIYDDHSSGGGGGGWSGGGGGGGGGGWSGGGGGGGNGGGGGDGGWWRRRNMQDSHDLAYSGYRSFNNTATPNEYLQQ